MKAHGMALQIVALAVLTGGGAGCDRSAAPPAQMLVGEVQPLGEGSVRSWVTLDAAGNPSAVGVTLTEAALAALAADRPSLLTLALPREAGATAFDHLELEWLPRGHAPEGIFDRPHLDVRFHTVGVHEREGLQDAEKAAQVPLLDLLPETYVPLPGWIPRLGTRWIDPLAPELSGEPLSSSLLYGFYNGEMAFLEKVVTPAFLEGQPNLSRELKLPQSYPRPGYYPTRYRVGYDAATQEYTVALEELVRRP